MNCDFYIGKTYNKWTIIKYGYYCNKGKGSIVHAKCECGYEKTINLKSVITEKSKMCMRCSKNLQRKEHRVEDIPVYRVWAGMKERCSNKNHAMYKYYGGRGITVCERWHKFLNFYEDMGDRPTNKHSIDRINNDVGYCKENCKWSTPEEQSRNRRKYDLSNGHKNMKKIVRIDNNGETVIFNSLKEAVAVIGSSISALSSALHKEKQWKGYKWVFYKN